MSPGLLPPDPAGQRSLAAALLGSSAERLGVDVASDAVAMHEWRCCEIHPDWVRQVLVIGRVRVAERVSEPATGAYVEDVASEAGIPGERRYGAPRGVALPKDIERRAAHALDGEPWRPLGGAPRSGRTIDELAATVLRLTSEKRTAIPPMQSEIAGLPGYPLDRGGVARIVSGAVYDGLPWWGGRPTSRRVPLGWPLVYAAAAWRAAMLDDWEARGEIEKFGVADAVYLSLAPASRARVRHRLKERARMRR
ncbi:MAG: hypothetical protein U0838_01580 [Chloroflexota bacterium]